ncbi:MAG: 3-hydroxyacyl-CoA dehydrogenase NAD-binding domain-containing protein [Planctomycetota bacterium]|nr:3-hydroxyacyl-CoA dehydrogenase NAD-binding domain-containing protein [Planctomycetota bacterium]
MSATWHVDELGDGIMRVTINREDRPVNSLSRQSLEELSRLITRINSDSSLNGVLFISGKPGNFIAGADVTELKDLQDQDAARNISQFGQSVFQALEDLTVPTVALISGACLGGGLEFAMSCRYRIAADDSKTLLALPEVQLGLIPGWGGTIRLPKLIGFLNAMPMILTGKKLGGHQARSKGLVHDTVPVEALLSVGEKIIQACVEKGTANHLFRKPKKPLWLRLVERRGVFQKYAVNKAEKQVLAKSHGHYPAPQAACEALRSGIGRRDADKFAIESEIVSKLADNPVTAECMRLFFLQEDAKKPPADMDLSDVGEIHNAAVIGAGAMGAGIALMLAKKDIWTQLKDLKPEFVANGIKTVRTLVGKEVKRKRTSKTDAQRALDHLSPTTEYRGLKHADIVIEAVLEDVEIKRSVFRELAAAANDKTVLATNTSSLLVKDIAEGVPHPERVVGLHFFNPPHQMPLVEIIHTDQTSPEALATTIALARRIGKTMVVVGDCAGFLVNRLLAPYMNEAGFLLAEVASPMDIDRAMVSFGMPMGPLELTDLVGVGVAAHVAENMHKAYGDRMKPAPLWNSLKQLKAPAGQKPKLLYKTRKGHGLNQEVARAIVDLRADQKPVTAPGREEIIERLVYPIINEAARCLEEGIARRPEDVDLAMVFGTGFAPFRGGPLRYADSIGLQKIVDSLEAYSEQHPHLAPSQALKDMAKREQPFFLEPVQPTTIREAALA